MSRGGRHVRKRELEGLIHPAYMWMEWNNFTNQDSIWWGKGGSFLSKLPSFPLRFSPRSWAIPILLPGLPPHT